MYKHCVHFIGDEGSFYINKSYQPLRFRVFFFLLEGLKAFWAILNPTKKCGFPLYITYIKHIGIQFNEAVFVESKFHILNKKGGFRMILILIL